MEVVRPFGMMFWFSAYENHVRFDPTAGGENNRTVAQTTVSLHTLGEIDLLVSLA